MTNLLRDSRGFEGGRRRAPPRPGAGQRSVVRAGARSPTTPGLPAATSRATWQPEIGRRGRSSFRFPDRAGHCSKPARTNAASHTPPGNADRSCAGLPRGRRGGSALEVSGPAGPGPAGGPRGTRCSRKVLPRPPGRAARASAGAGLGLAVLAAASSMATGGAIEPGVGPGGRARRSHLWLPGRATPRPSRRPRMTPERADTVLVVETRSRCGRFPALEATTPRVSAWSRPGNQCERR